MFNQVIDDHTVNTWSQFMTEFTALGDESTIRFTSITPSVGTMGNFIDNVVVTEADQVPVSTPSILIMTLLSLCLMFVRRTRA